MLTWIAAIGTLIAGVAGLASYLHSRWRDQPPLPGIEVYTTQKSPLILSFRFYGESAKGWRIVKISPAWPWSGLTLTPVTYQGGDGTPFNPGAPVAGKYKQAWKSRDGVLSVELAVKSTRPVLHFRARLVRSDAFHRKIRRSVPIVHTQITANDVS